MTPIRRARRADLPALRAIQAASLAEPWEELLPIAVDGPPILLVAADPDPVGYALCVAGQGSDGGESPTAPADGVSDAAASADGVRDATASTGGSTAYLVELAVAPSERGRGRGSALLAALIDELESRGVDRLSLTVRDVDERARSFYADHGFERRERLPDHYEASDGLLLVKPLD